MMSFDKKNAVFFISILIIATNAFFNSQFQLQADEAYYWVLGQNLSLSYFDHPPMVAYLIRLCTSLFGQSEFFVRLPALISFVVSLIFIYKLSLKMFNQRVANIALILALSFPMLEAISVVITPDSPLMMFWILTLYCFYVGVFEGNKKYIYFAGFFAGLDLLSKYTAVLLFPSLFLFLLFSKQYRNQLFKKELYLAFILSLLVFSPVIIWNFQNHWSSFLFQTHHGFENFGTRIAFLKIAENVSNYLGIMVLLVFPFIFFSSMYYIIKYFKANLQDEKLSFLLWNFLFGAIFFAAAGVFNRLEANWPAPIYLTVLILLAFYLDKNNNRWVSRASLILVVVLLVVARIPRTVFSIIPSLRNGRGTERLFYYGSKEMLMQVKPYLKQDTQVLGCDYQNASLAWYYLNLSRVYVLTDTPHQYSYWNDQITAPITNAIFICNNSFHNTDLDKVLNENFKVVKLVEIAKFSNEIGDYKTHVYDVSLKK